jgi:hypothetical protein
VKRFIISSCVFAIALCAQDSSVSRSTSVDINGRRVADGPDVARTKSGNDTEVTERTQSVNGRSVPLERVEERVLRDDSSGRVVERVIRRFSPTGEPAPPLKETIEQQKHSDGSSTIQMSTYEGNINGGMELRMKSVTEKHVAGSSETADTVVQRPTVNGSLETVEKQSTVIVKNSGGGFREDSTTYRRDGNGSFTAAVRVSTEHVQQGTEASDQTAEYEVGSDGRLQLHSQAVVRTVTRADGSKETERNVFGTNVPGKVDPSSKLTLQEQQVVEKKPGPGGTVVETLSVRRPSVADPNALGPSQQVSETVCRGKCDK